MNSKAIVFSYPFPVQGQPQSWLESVQSQISSLSPQTIHLELNAYRSGIEGNLEDNPPIELIDELQQTAEETGTPFQTLFLPVNLQQPDEALGTEISNCNGWTDLAVYMGIAHVRLHLPAEPNFSHEPIELALLNIVRYLQDSKVRVSLGSNDPKYAAAKTFIHKFKDQFEATLGLDWIVKAQELKPQEFIEALDLPVNTVTLEVQTVHEISLTSICNILQDHFTPAPQIVLRQTI